MRKDAQQKREELIDAALSLLADQGPGFSLAAVAEAAGQGTATAYRHFGTVDSVLEAGLQRLLGQVTREIEQVLTDDHATAGETFNEVCSVWATSALSWAPWAARFRSGEGFLVRSHDSSTNEYRHRAALETVLARLVDAGEIPDQEDAVAVVVWVALFDERVMVDLTDAGYSPAQIVVHLTERMWVVLRHPNTN